jgi:hypothetical protein
MRAEELYSLLQKFGTRLEGASLLGFESYERTQTLKNIVQVTVLEDVKYREGVWKNYYAGVLVAEDGSVVGVYATSYYRDDPWGYSASTTYVASLKPLKVKLVELHGASVEVHDPPSKRREWRERRVEREIEVPTLPPELAKKLVEEMRNSTYVKYIRLGEKLVEIKWPEL